MMKRFILTVIVAAFAVAVQADDVKSCQDKAKDKDKAGCCANKVKTSSEQAKEGGCPFAKSACCSKQASDKTTAAKTTTAKQTALVSPKAADAAK
jgi:hypothetical protein